MRLRELVTLFLVSGQGLFAHCQIPCGIYHDENVVGQLEEAIETMEKSMHQIHENKMESALDTNQMVRWVMNKEEHANKLAGILTEYFLKQRIKPDDPQVTQKVTSVHRMLVSSMKVKQTVDKTHVEALKKELKAFKAIMYPKKSS